VTIKRGSKTNAGRSCKKAHGISNEDAPGEAAEQAGAAEYRIEKLKRVGGCH